MLATRPIHDLASVLVVGMIAVAVGVLLAFVVIMSVFVAGLTLFMGVCVVVVAVRMDQFRMVLFVAEFDQVATVGTVCRVSVSIFVGMFVVGGCYFAELCGVR